MPLETLGEDFDAGEDGFLDAAAVMMNLDLIITSDTSIAHLAGALARPVWVGLQHVPDWRWMLPQPDGPPGGVGGSPLDSPLDSPLGSPEDTPLGTPWYPTMRLFRQTQRGEWAGVFAEMAAALAPMLAAGHSVEGGPQ
jgi:hypothetical protein